MVHKHLPGLPGAGDRRQHGDPLGIPENLRLNPLIPCEKLHELPGLCPMGGPGIHGNGQGVQPGKILPLGTGWHCDTVPLESGILRDA